MQLAQQGKDFGQTTINAGAHKVTVDIRKRVEWNQDALIDAFNQMDPDTAKHYATVKYTVSEAKYKAAPPEIVGLLSEARTVHLQGVSVDIEDRKTDASNYLCRRKACRKARSQDCDRWQVGVGKTSLVRTLDMEKTLFMDLEAGDAAIEGCKVDVIRPRTWQECRDFACFLGGGNRFE